jgi:beta-hydroxylase
VGLDVPPGERCAVWCDGEVETHAGGQVLVFDDSKLHKAYNETDRTRVVLIVDLARPPGVPPGRAVGDRTPELNNIIEFFS